MPIAERLVPDPPIRVRDVPIGAIGSGFIMADVQLAAYARAGFPVVAIASRDPQRAQSVAGRWNIPKVHAEATELIRDPAVAILDLAVPPHVQPELIREALRQPHIRGILAQKPLALTLSEAALLAAEAEAAGKLLSVNQNMRFDQSMRALKRLLVDGALGDPVLMTIDMRAVPHWQAYLAQYDRLTLLNMSIHHLDILRFLLGEPTHISTAARPDPRTPFAHTDGICCSTLMFANGAMAVSLEDVWVTPDDTRETGDTYINWRLEGTGGTARGSIGWPDYPEGSPSTLSWRSPATGGKWMDGTSWTTQWFPDAFAGTMEQLQHAVATGTVPELSAADNLLTMALVEAGYLSLSEGRHVRPADLMKAQASK